MANAAAEIALRDRGKLQQSGFIPLWKSCADFCCPHKAQAIQSTPTADQTFRTNPTRHNSVAVDSLNVLAGGCKSWITPGPATGWWQWEPSPGQSESFALKKWLADCTARADRALEGSGFYSESHLLYADLGVFGTSGLMIDAGERAPISFKCFNPSSFVFFTDWEGSVDRVLITWMRTAQQLVDTFGRSACPETVLQDVDTGKPDASHEMLQSIYRRPDNERAAVEYGDDPASMPFAACWIHVASKQILRESGFNEMPFTVPRWQLWSDSSVYGASPAMNALADIRGVNLIDMLTALTVELQVNPRVKVGPGQTGTVDLSPGGVTVTADPEQLREWATPGRADIGVGFAERKEQQIRRAFHADLFERLAPIEREMTRYEVQAREREAVSRITPAMGRLATDFIAPTMRRVFMLLYRAGYFPPAPEEAFYTDQIGRRYLLFPRTVQTNRMAAAVQSRKVFAFHSIMERVGTVAQAKPEILDLYDFEVMFRDLDLGDGMPSEWHISPEQVKAMRAARAEAQQQQQMAALAQEMAVKQPAALASAAEALTGGKPE